HPNITIFANSELVKVDGYIGNFKAKIRKNPRYVNPNKCTGCGECKDACPIEYPNEWDMNLGTRKAISVPFDQTVPLIYAVNKDYCIECFKCVDACGDRQAIDFERLILAAGPTGGKVIRQSDGQKPHRIAFIQCVGSRDKSKYPYCSNFCCMYTLKHVVQLK